MYKLAQTPDVIHGKRGRMYDRGALQFAPLYPYYSNPLATNNVNPLQQDAAYPPPIEGVYPSSGGLYPPDTNAVYPPNNTEIPAPPAATGMYPPNTDAAFPPNNSGIYPPSPEGVVVEANGDSKPQITTDNEVSSAASQYANPGYETAVLTTKGIELRPFTDEHPPASDMSDVNLTSEGMEGSGHM